LQRLTTLIKFIRIDKMGPVARLIQCHL
jgi:hypothetical protein